MKRQSSKAVRKSKLRREGNRVEREAQGLQLSLRKEDLIKDLQNDVHTFAVRMGLAIGLEVIEAEVQEMCGKRYDRGSEASRYGRQGGYIIIGGQKVEIERPRVRQDDKEISLKSYKLLQQSEALSGAVMARAMGGVSIRGYEATIEKLDDGFATKRSSVSRIFTKATAKAVVEFEKRSFEGERFLAIYIDGVEYAGETLVAALGIDRQGNKKLLGLRHGATENTEVCTSLLSDLVGRGLNCRVATLFILDGGKALKKAVTDVFGRYAIIQRCQVHKKRNIKAHVPEKHWEEINKRLSEAYNCTSYAAGLKKLNTTARWLDRLAPDAANSLREGMEETITVLKLGLPTLLMKSLSSTNVIESALSVARSTTSRVKRWRDGSMRKRWCTAGLLRAQSRFQKIQGASSLIRLEKALDNLVLSKSGVDSIKEAA